jgi:hypothetical protein
LSFSWLRAGLTENQARTHPEHPDPGLRGRTYAIPFARVWEAAFAMASGGLRGWSVSEADEDLGLIRAESSTLIFRFIDDVEINVSLDENAQTRVDMSSSSRRGRGDLGQNARRIKRFFRILDRKIGAGPGLILDPTLPLHRASLLLLVALGACGTSSEPPPGEALEEAATAEAERNFQSLTYERHIVFLTTGADSTILVPWSFLARTLPEGTQREVRGWLARSETWDAFVEERWDGPPTRVPWRILPRGPVRLVVGLGDALERIIFQEGGRNLDVVLEGLRAEWSGQRGQRYRLHDATLILSDRTLEGVLLDMTRAWSDADGPPGDWGIAVSGDSLQVVMESRPKSPGAEGGDYAAWARVAFSDRQWQGLRLLWTERRAFEPARRDVPVSWEVQSTDGDLGGSFSTLAPYLEALEGEGPVLPVEGLFQVAGTLNLDGLDFPVRGFIRHTQR